MKNTNKQATLWTKDFNYITCINFIMFFCFQIILTTLPIYIKSLGVTDSVIGWLSGVFTISALLIRPFSGIALDRFGRKIVFLIGLGVIIIVTISYGWLPIVGAVLVLRFIHGFGWGMATTASSTIASDIIPKKRFGEGMGYFSLSNSLSMAIAPGIALTILGLTNFRVVSVVSGGLGIVALSLSLFIRYQKVEKKEAHSNKMLPYEKASIAPSVVMFFVTTSYGAVVGFISLYALENGIDNIGLFFAVYAISLLIFRPFFGKIVDRFGFNAVIFPGLGLLIAAMLVISYASSIFYFLLAAFLYGVGFGAVQSTLQTMAVIKAPKERIGAANATFFTGFDAGIGFGSVIAGIVASKMGYNWMYLAFSAFLMIALVLYFIINRHGKKNL